MRSHRPDIVGTEKCDNNKSLHYFRGMSTCPTNRLSRVALRLRLERIVWRQREKLNAASTPLSSYSASSDVLEPNANALGEAACFRLAAANNAE